MVTVFPNPCKDQLRLNSKLRISQIKVYNISGELMFEKELYGETQHNLSVSNLINGAYILHLIFENGKAENHLFIKN